MRDPRIRQQRTGLDGQVPGSDNERNAGQAAGQPGNQGIGAAMGIEDIEFSVAQNGPNFSDTFHKIDVAFHRNGMNRKAFAAQAPDKLGQGLRPEERRVGKGVVSASRSRRSAVTQKKKKSS